MQDEQQPLFRTMLIKKPQVQKFAKLPSSESQPQLGSVSRPTKLKARKKALQVADKQNFMGQKYAEIQQIIKKSTIYENNES